MDDFLGPLTSLIPVVALVSVRIGVAVAMLPAPFGSVAPTPVRAALTVMLAITLALPMYDGTPVDLGTFALGRAAVGELLVGAAIGLTVRVTLAAAEIAGTFAGFSMGLGFAGSVDPMFGEMSLPSTRLIGSLGALIFFVVGGHHVVIGALGASLDAAPVGDAFSAIAHAGIVEIGSDMLSNGLRIAAPVVATMFIVQIGTGLISRAAPRVQIFSLSFAVAAAAGSLTLLVAAPSIATAIGVEINRLPDRILEALGGP
ncbi:MAG: flagellar biosynthetic protein FliR [Myxococcota bacterium]